MTLAKIRQFALTLPGVTEEPHFHRTSFRVRGRIFVTAVPQEPYINVMIGDAGREPMLAMHAEWMEKLMWGKKAVGLRVDLRRAQESVVRELVRQAWAEKAPKSLQPAP